MSEKKFENQVRQVMDEFSLPPTAPVWDRIAAEIKRKKNRRRFVLWLIPFVLLSSGITWWSLSSTGVSSDIASQKKEINSQDTKNKNEIKHLNKVAIQRIENKTAKAQSKTKETKTEIVQPKNENRLTKKNTKGFKGTAYSSYIIAKKIKNAENRIVAFSHPPIKIIKEEKSFSAQVPVLTKEKLQDTLIKNETPVITNTLNQNNNLATPQRSDTIETIKQPEQSAMDSSKTSEQIKEQKPQNKKNKKLQFGAIVQIGYSGITSGLFDGFGQKSLQDFAAPSPNSSGPGGVANLPPSKIKRGFAYSLGFSARKKISSRGTIYSGLQYKYYSTKINVGTRGARDSTFSNVSRDAVSYFQNDNLSKSYTNQFHFVTLPVSYEYQLFKKLPLHLGAGLHLSQLISSNALHYSSSANIYYKDNSLLNKTQAGLFTMLKYKLWKQKKFSVDVGPQFNYSLTPLQKNGNSKKQHLFSLELNTQISF